MSDFNGETDLHREVKFLLENTGDINNAVRWYQYDLKENGPEGIRDTLEADLIALAIIKQARQTLADIEHDLEQVLANVMPKEMNVEGFSQPVEKLKNKSRTSWHKDELLPDVLDTRMFDRHDGSLIEETPLDKVLAVWNLGAPRLGAMRDRGLDPDQYCHTEDRGWSIRFPSN